MGRGSHDQVPHGRVGGGELAFSKVLVSHPGPLIRVAGRGRFPTDASAEANFVSMKDQDHVTRLQAIAASLFRPL